MTIPYVIITAQSRKDRTITVYGRVIGLGAGSITAELPAASTPNGAVSKPAVAVTLNPVGEFAHAFTTVAYGNYAPAIITASNLDGTHVATSMPMLLPAPGTSPVGTPVVLFPQLAIPTFTTPSVALNAEVTTVTLESTSSSNQTNVPFSFGQPFKQGDLAPGNFLVGKVAGQADVPLQLNVRATHPDGSVRHAQVSGVLPALAAGASTTISMVRSASGASTVPTSSQSIAADGVTAQVSLTTGGVTYSASAAPALAAGLGVEDAWISGALATEYSINVPFKDGNGAAHPDLTAQFNVRHFPGAHAAKIDVVVEHVKAYTAINDVYYVGEVRVGGAVVMTLVGANGGEMAHYPDARWKRTFWWNHTSPVHVKHNVPYFIGSRQVPNYDQSVVIPETVLAEYEAALLKPEFAPMGRGLFAAVFGGTGGRPELGLMSSWYAAALLSQDRRAKKLMLALAECAGSFGSHRRDHSAGPNAGKPFDLAHFPSATLLGTSGDSKNSATGAYEKLPSRNTSSNFGPDTSHQSSFAYLPYLATGDLYYLEELHFWCNWNLYQTNPGYRSYEKGLVWADQVRGQGWSMRTLGQAAAITPDSHPAKQRFNFWLDTNLRYFNNTYTDNPSANQLGAIVTGAAVVYSVNGVSSTGVSNFMDDFWMQSVGHIAELGNASALRLARWKAKWQVSRMIGPGYCYSNAVNYAMMVRLTKDSPFFTTIAEVGENTIPAEERALPCNSQERYDYMNAKRALPSEPYQLGDLTGYPSSTEGFPANLQPALAYAVDVGYPDADLAWDQFDSRPTKPNYGKGAQFAVVPRGFVAPPPDPDPTPDPDPQPTDPDTMAIADSVKDSTNSTGTGNITLAGAPQNTYQTWYPAIALNERSPYTIRHRTANERESGFGHLTSELVFVRDEVTSSTNANQLVNFSAGIKDVENNLTAGLYEELSGAHNVVVQVLSEDPTGTEFMILVNGKPRSIKMPDLGMTFNQLPLLPSAIIDSDQLHVFRDGVDYRAPRSYLGSATPADTSAPVLTTPTASSTGTTTASGSVSTNEANGTLFCLASQGSTATATAIKASAFSQAVTATGAQSVSSINGLTAATTYYLHFLHRDAAGNDSAPVVSSSFTTASAGDTTAPTLSSPTGTQTGSSTASGSVSTNEGNGTLYRMASVNATETAATVKAANLTSTVTASGTQNVTFTGLNASTLYYAHYVHRDAAGNDSTVANSSGFTTAAPVDTQAPTLSNQSATATGSTTASGSVSTNEANGTLYRYISVNASETAATVKASGTTATVTTAGVQNVNFTGLTAATQYYAHYLHRDAAGNDSTVASSIAFTTDAAVVAYNVTGYSSNGVKTSISNDTSAPVYNGNTQKGFSAFRTMINGNGYYSISPTPASAVSGWSTSSTVPPSIITSAENNNSGESSKNGAIAMNKPNAWQDVSYVWVPATPGTYNRSFWIKPVDGEWKMMGTIAITIV